ncbi:MAG: TlpA family protein disulfide reductase [Bacteroidales bacterium]|jgi:thiol-disulfide isomerase/thioredoxin|nr:TlpA family protein disulfide reductase [Bacteroidales bacterium]
MKKIFLFLLLTAFAVCCKRDNVKPGTVTVTGRVENYNGKNANLSLLVEQPGAENVRQALIVDEDGRFSFSFKAFSSFDAMLLDNNTFANINFIYHPGDSIHISFSANGKMIPLMKSVKFSGNASETNNQIIKFQILREKHKLGYGAVDPETAYKLSEPDFTERMSEIRQRQRTLADSVIHAGHFSKEAEIWIKDFACETYYYFLWDYGSENKLSDSYYNYDAEISSFSSGQLVSWFITKGRILNYFRDVLLPSMRKKYGSAEEDTVKGNADSLMIEFLYGQSSNKLLNDLILASYYSEQFGKREIDGYSRNERLIKSKIGESFIMEALEENYKKTYDHINNPQRLTDTILTKIKNTPIDGIVNKILQENRGRVIYLDCWATYCGPCRKEMVYSKELMEKLQDKDISFVYVCLDSNEKEWKSIVSGFKMKGGRHYLLNREQSKYFRNLMGIHGIPFYFLIDKKGRIVDRGSTLRPDNKQTESKISRLLQIS